MLLQLLLFCLAYSIGAIPAGFLIARFAGIRDIRLYGSGNIGATNIGRMLGLKYFLLVFLVDMGKAFVLLKTLFLCNFTDITICLTACGLLIGNCWSVFLKGSGGKGVSTSFGILCACVPFLLLTIAIVWFSSILAVKRIGIASAITAATLPLIAWLIGLQMPFLILMLFMALVVLYKHRTNMRFYFQTIR